jgi:hypothetical protein
LVNEEKQIETYEVEFSATGGATNLPSDPFPNNNITVTNLQAFPIILIAEKNIINF